MKNPPFSAEQRAMVIEMWKKNATAQQIAEAIGRTRNAICGFLDRNRDVCPQRRDYISHHRKSARTIPKKHPQKPAKSISADYMIFTTSTGYRCPMPRVSILEARG
jgi:IS30 family transposase